MLFFEISPACFEEKEIFSFFTSSKVTIGCYSSSFSHEPNTLIAKQIKIEEGLWKLTAGYGRNLKKIAELELNLQAAEIMRLSAKKYARTDMLDELNAIAKTLDGAPSSFRSVKSRMKKTHSESAFVKYLIAQIEKRARNLINEYAYRNDIVRDGHYVFTSYTRSQFSRDLFKAVLERTISVISLAKPSTYIVEMYESEVKAAHNKLASFINSDTTEVSYFNYSLANSGCDLDDLSWSMQDLGIATSEHISVADSHVHAFIVKTAMCDDFSPVIKDMTDRSALPFKCGHTFGATFLRLPKSKFEEDQKLFLYVGKLGNKIVAFRLSKTRLQNAL